MKAYVSRRTAACITGCALLVSSFISTGCVSSSPRAAKTEKATYFSADQSFSMELQARPDSSIIHMVVQKPVGKKVWITFKDREGNALERISTQKWEAGIDGNFNFSQAADGLYSFEITDGQKTITKTVNVQRVSTEAKTQFVVN